MNKQQPELSAFFDDELEEHDLAALLDAAVRDSEMRFAWQAYSLIGDHLREEPALAVDLTSDVMARLREEPVVLAPRNLQVKKQQHPLFALAASVAGVAVVGWLAISVNVSAPPADGKFAAVPPQPTFARAPREAAPTLVATTNPVQSAPMRGDMSEYLLAHQTHAASFRLGDSTEHIRTVALTGQPVSR